ncbi:MAG TPA: cytochrome c biogenesis protein CcsA [Candidatus Binatia bacterium]
MNDRRIWRDTLLPALTCVAMLAALYMVFVLVPSEREQGVVQRIFYFHVNLAWMAFAGFVFVAIASVQYLRTGSRRADQLAHANAEVGLLYTTLVLVTGPIWARPIWGVWWTWDPRLTMTVVLWAIYAAYLMLRRLGGNDDTILRYAAVLGIVGTLDIPLLILAVRLWRGVHPAVMLSDEPDSGLKDPLMGWTLLVSGVALALLFTWLVSLRARVLAVDESVAALQLEGARS